MGTPITSKQRTILDSLICERLSSSPANKVLIKGLVNTRNPNLVSVLQSNRAWQEDEGNITAYYLVKSGSGTILAFFALRCGEVFQNVDEELIKEAASFRQNIDKLNGSLDEEEKRKVLEQVSVALRDGWTKELADYYIRKSKRRRRDAVLDNNKDNHHVAKAFSAVEITLFCNNEAEGFTVINKEELDKLRESAENAENYKKWWLAKDHEVDKMNMRIKELEDGLEKAGDIIKMLLMNEL